MYTWLYTNTRTTAYRQTNDTIEVWRGVHDPAIVSFVPCILVKIRGIKSGRPGRVENQRGRKYTVFALLAGTSLRHILGLAVDEESRVLVEVGFLYECWKITQ